MCGPDCAGGRRCHCRAHERRAPPLIRHRRMLSRPHDTVLTNGRISQDVMRKRMCTLSCLFSTRVSECSVLFTISSEDVHIFVIIECCINMTIIVVGGGGCGYHVSSKRTTFMVATSTSVCASAKMSTACRRWSTLAMSQTTTSCKQQQEEVNNVVNKIPSQAAPCVMGSHEESRVKASGVKASRY